MKINNSIKCKLTICSNQSPFDQDFSEQARH